MKTLYKIIILLLVIALIGIYVTQLEDERNEILVNENTTPALDYSIESDNQKNKLNDEVRPKEGVSLLIGQSEAELQKQFGKPDRIDTSSYGYDWWVYNKNLARYMQVGIDEGKVVTIFVSGRDMDLTPFKIGQPVDEIYSSTLIEPEVSLQLEDSMYRFELSEEDMNVRPLIMLGDIFVQLYIDKFTGTLSSVRFLDGPTLVKQRSYELVYRGTLFEATPLSEEEWKQVEQGSQLQILDLTNIMRERFKLQPLSWDEKIAQVAYSHSKDMFEGNYFSHESPEFGSLADRLEAAEVYYQMAGENIAAQYVDAPAAVEGWLNSKGHRETMLNESFSHIGVGVYQKYYTQNFIQEWKQ